MTAKRFEINNDMNLDDKVETYELSCIVDNSNKTFYFIVDNIANVESFVERLNELHEENQLLKLQSEIKLFSRRELEKENEKLKEHQRTLEAKIVRLKDRVKTFEKHYSLKDIERYKKMDNCNCITSKWLEE